MAPRPALDRLRLRPSASDWQPDELLTFAEAAALVFPQGPLSAAALRSASRRGELWSTRIAGRTFTTRMAVDEMIATPRPDRTAPRATAEPGSAGAPVSPDWSRIFRDAIAEPRRP